MTVLQHGLAIIRSFGFALRGWGWALRERNMLVHLLATVLVIGLGLYLQISQGEWLALAIVIGVVMVTEIFNTAIEVLCNAVTKEWRADIGKIKDLSSGAVLMSAVMAVAVAAIIFGPKLMA